MPTADASGSEDTTEEMLERHGPLVMQVIWNLVPVADDARDIFQDTFLQHYLAMRQGRSIHNPRAWLCQTARHGAFRLFRARQSAPDRASSWDADQHPAPATDPDHPLLLARIRTVAASLPDRQAQVFIMRHFEHLSFAEIADQLGCSAAAARASGYKALQRIRSLLGDKTEESHV